MKEGIWYIFDIRNAEVHPYFLNLNTIEETNKGNKDSKLPVVDENKLFMETSNFYSKLSKVKNSKCKSLTPVQLQPMNLLFINVLLDDSYYDNIKRIVS